MRKTFYVMYMIDKAAAPDKLEIVCQFEKVLGHDYMFMLITKSNFTIH